MREPIVGISFIVFWTCTGEILSLNWASPDSVKATFVIWEIYAGISSAGWVPCFMEGCAAEESVVTLPSGWKPKLFHTRTPIPISSVHKHVSAGVGRKRGTLMMIMMDCLEWVREWGRRGFPGFLSPCKMMKLTRVVFWLLLLLEIDSF